MSRHEPSGEGERDDVFGYSSTELLSRPPASNTRCCMSALIGGLTEDPEDDRQQVPESVCAAHSGHSTIVSGSQPPAPHCGDMTRMYAYCTVRAR